jgi:hypothetical protein
MTQRLPPWGGEVCDVDVMERVGGGGTHDVYLHPYRSGFVVRIPRMPVAEAAIEANGENARFALLERHFGPWCIPRIAEVALVRRGGVTFESILITEPFEPALHDLGRVGITLSYLERKPDTREIRDRVDAAMIDKTDFPLADLLSVADEMLPLFAAMAADAALVDLIADFYRRASSFVRETGLLLDCAGADNIVAVQAAGYWTLRIGAVLKKDTWPAFTAVLKRLAMDGSAATVTDAWSAATLLNGMAFLRLLSAITAAIGEEAPSLPQIPNLRRRLDEFEAAFRQQSERHAC